MTYQIAQCAQYAALTALAKDTPLSLKQLLFEPNRVKNFTFTHETLRVDITRQRLNHTVWSQLMALALDAKVPEKRDAFLQGQSLENNTSVSAHTALRAPQRRQQPEWEKLVQFVNSVRSEGAYRDVVNLGIGGSCTGAMLVSSALAPRTGDIKIHYVSNMDPTQLHDTLQACQPEKTLFIISSHSFTTAETLANAALARTWLQQHNLTISKHIVAVSADVERATAWGIPEDNIFPISDKISGRYSIWSAMALPAMIDLGVDSFVDLLRGAHSMDTHFAQAPLAQNLPVVLALLRIWNTNFLHHPTCGLLIYDQRLDKLIPWLQQVEMESNGKSVTLDNHTLQQPAGTLIWGGIGTDVQHSFGQFLHQSQMTVPLDILIPLTPSTPMNDDWIENHHRLVKCAIAQAESLAIGTSNEQAQEHCTGERPSTVISWRKTDPYTLGQLMALYEHTTITSGFIWNIDSFNQHGVELGKSMAHALTTSDLDHFSPSAQALLACLQST